MKVHDYIEYTDYTQPLMICDITLNHSLIQEWQSVLLKSALNLFRHAHVHGDSHQYHTQNSWLQQGKGKIFFLSQGKASFRSLGGKKTRMASPESPVPPNIPSNCAPHPVWLFFYLGFRLHSWKMFSIYLGYRSCYSLVAKAQWERCFGRKGFYKNYSRVLIYFI